MNSDIEKLLKESADAIQIEDFSKRKEKLIKLKNTTEQLERYLQFIEDEKNYYAGFPYVIENAVMAKQIAKHLCFNTTICSDAEYHAYLTRIDAARENAIKTHGEWTIKMLEQSKTQHTPRTFVSSVYSDIFGIELKGEEG